MGAILCACARAVRCVMCRGLPRGAMREEQVNGAEADTTDERVERQASAEVRPCGGGHAWKCSASCARVRAPCSA